MDADTAIQAIIKFNARRPGLNKLYSDQGSNFTAADKILKRELAEINKNAIPGLAKMGISWNSTQRGRRIAEETGNESSPYPTTTTTTTTPGGDGLRTTWKHAISRINGFWKSFRKDYLTLLHQRPKWTKTKKDLKASDLVIVVDETTSRDAWKLGRVLSITSTGTHVRTVEVQLASGKIRSTDRSSLVLLELDE